MITAENLVFMASHFRLEDGQLITLCPPASAPGAYDLRSRGRGMDWAFVDAWPSPRYKLTTTGIRQFWCLDMTGMWQQEAYVYLRELGMSVNAALTSLSVPDEQTCTECGKVFLSRYTRKYCSKKCSLKNFHGRRLKAMNAFAETLRYNKPKIGKEGRWWKIRGIDKDGTYVSIPRRFMTFDQALALVSKLQPNARVS